MIASTKFVRQLGNVSKKIGIFALLFSFAFSPIAPAINAYAQESDQSTVSDSDSATINDDGGASVNDGSDSGHSPDTSSPDTDLPATTPEQSAPEQIEETPAVDEAPVPSPESDEDQGLDPQAVTAVEEVATSTATTTTEVIPTGKKFKKDLSLSQEEQLAAVRQFLQSNNQTIALDRLNEFEIEQGTAPAEDGIFKKVINFLTGNTEEAKAKAEAIEFAKREPFQVLAFDGKIKTSDIKNFEKDFAKAKEQGSLIQKVKNFIQAGTFFNSNFDKTKERQSLISRLFGLEKVIADASNNPDDYLDEGGEITFSQAIQDKADELNNDPLAILNYVRSETEYIPYYGSKKGAAATLAELAGNDTDKSSLLIAMLRYSDVPARYRQADIKIDAGIVTDLLGVQSPDAAAAVLSLMDIPYTLYTQDGEPYFFVIEHTYVEAYIPYGYSRGLDEADGGDSQWIAMEPTVNLYTYSKPLDIVGGMKSEGFVIENFYDDYLNLDYDIGTEPLDAFKEEVEDYLASSTDYAYEDAIMTVYPSGQTLSFVPGSLPFEIATDLNTYDFMPAALRHTVDFTVKDTSNTVVLTHTAYLSDIANKELLVTYNAATGGDQTTIDMFDTIYDVVPLSIVAVKPVIKVNGDVVAAATATSTLGYSQKYEMEFTAPTRDLGEAVGSEVINTYEKSILTGNTDAIALNTDRVTPPELRPIEDVESNSYLSEKILYRTVLTYLEDTQITHQELAALTGGDFTHRVTKASINNGVNVTYSSGVPYSFDWVGLRIDAYSNVAYFNRFSDTITTNRKEFIGIFGLQASQDESDIFEEQFDVESVATVKGLKMVADGEFPGVTLEKITSANEGDIDGLNISTSTKTVFHTAVDNGRIVYTPSEPITYGEWEGLFYITIDFDGGDATYAIGEGLNGGYTACGTASSGGLCNWAQGNKDSLIPRDYSTANSTIAVSDSTPKVGDVITVAFTNVKNTVGGWINSIKVKVTKKAGRLVFTPINGSGSSSTVNPVSTAPIGSENNEYDKEIRQVAVEYGIPAGLLKAIIHRETKQDPFNPKSSRYEPKRDYNDFQKATPDRGMTSAPYSNFTLAGKRLGGASVPTGSKISSLKTDPYKVIRNVTNGGWHLRGIVHKDRNSDSVITFSEVYQNDKEIDGVRSQGWYVPGVDFPSGDFSPQYAISASYGLGHVMYPEAVESATSSQPVLKGDKSPQSMVDDPKLGIAVAAAVLKGKYSGPISNDGCDGWSQAISRYNSLSDYKPEVCKMAQGIYN